MTDPEFPDSRKFFIESWLNEMPYKLENPHAYDQLVNDITDVKQRHKPIALGNKLFKIEAAQTVYYWYEDNNEILLGVGLTKTQQNLSVDLLGKNPRYVGKPPYASELYNEILKDSKYSIKLFSDKYLSDEGLSLWKNLFRLNRSISVYNANNPARTFQTFNNSTDLDAYFSDTNKDYSKYRYVISENSIMLWETKHFFSLRRYRELTGSL